MKKIREKLKKWLLEEELDRLYIWSAKMQSRIERAEKDYKEARLRFEEIIDVGADVHERSDSWAVVCIDGKQSYVKFVRLEKSNIREISDFLKRYERSNKVIDTPYGFPSSWWLK